MKALIDLANSTKRLSIQGLMEALASDRTFTDFIIELNTQRQLYDQGIDSTGRTLESIGGGYAPYTVFLKEQKGQPTDRVTLKDTGDFYESFRVYLTGRDLTIVSDPIKDTTNLLEEWGKNILGLTEESLEALREKAKPIILSYIKKILRRE